MEKSNTFRNLVFAILPILILGGTVLAVAPTTEKISRALMLGIGVTEQVQKLDAASTTPEAAFAIDLTASAFNQRTSGTTQEVLIRNTSTDLGGTADLLCVGLLAWSVNTCQVDCAASAFTCSGASTDGEHVGAAETYSRTLDGTSCVCVVGQNATSEYQSTRVIR